ARLAARVVRVVGALRSGAVHRVLAARDQPAVTFVLNRAVVLVREHDDGDQRVGTQERGTLSEHGGVDVLHDGLVGTGRHGDRSWRLGIDQEAIPSFERGFVTAAVLTRALHHVGELRGEGGAVRVTGRVVLAVG